jgi:hypothetical protein
MFGLFIVLLLILIAILGYRAWMKPEHERVINKLGNSLWLVDKTGVGEGASFYIKFGRFEQDSASSAPAGKVHFTKYGMDKAFEYDADLDWSRAGDSLRVGQMKLSLRTSPTGQVPTLLYTNDVESANAWTAPLKEVLNAPSKKL